jgi:DNA ligase (NAD+)
MAQGDLPHEQAIERLSREAAVQHSEALRREIRRHNYLYYVGNKPAISDEEYDRLFEARKRLAAAFPALITPGSPTQRVGAAPGVPYHRADDTHAQPRRRT